MASQEAEAWAKGYPDSKKKLNFEEYNSNFNWLTTWSENHLKKIIKKILPLFLLILVLSSYYLFKTSFYKTYSFKNKFSDKKILYILLFIGIYCFIWFLKFPVYRFGLSFISSFLIFSFIFFIVDNKKKIINKKYLFSFLILGIFIFYGKNFNRIINNFDNDYINSPWPAIYSMKKDEKMKLKNLKNIGSKRKF